MAEVGVERFGAGDREEHGAECDEADHAVVDEEAHAVDRIEGAAARSDSAAMCQSAGDRDGDEPDQRDRAEEGRDLRGAARLHREQRDQDHDRQRHDVGSKAGVAIFRPSTAESTDSAGVMMASP